MLIINYYVKLFPKRCIYLTQKGEFLLNNDSLNYIGLTPKYDVKFEFKPVITVVVVLYS
jgi:hypothetical protein